MSIDERDAPERKPAKSSASTASAPLLKEKLFIHTDGIKTSVPWRLADYEEKGALSEENMAMLAERFGLSRPGLERLSLYVGNSLDIESLVNLTTVRGDVAVARASPDLEEAARLAKRVEQNLAKMFAIVEPLSDEVALHDQQKRALATAKIRIQEARESAIGLHDAIDQAIKLPGSAAKISPDKRRIRDGRRIGVVESCCYAWHDEGRKVSYTTRADRLTDRRGGTLIKFIQAVVLIVTDPPTKLSGETIRKDIDRWDPQDLVEDEVSIQSGED